MRINVRFAAAVALALLPATAQARVVTVDVVATAGPWQVSVNKSLMPYGAGDQTAPVTVPFDLGGGRIGIYADGTTSVADKASIGPAGIDGEAVDDKLAKKKHRYPSFYTPKVLYPVNRHALVAAFVDDKGVVLGRPFAVGEGVRAPIPENAAALSFGFNDAVFSGSTGTLKVSVDLPE